MTDHADSGNPADRPEAIEELDNLHIGPPPIRAVIDAGHTAKRRRRTILVSVAASVVLVTGISVTAANSLGDRSDSPPPEVAAQSEPPEAVAPTVTTNPSLSSCAFEYPNNLEDQQFAFDATVASIGGDGSMVTLDVNRWYKGGSELQVVVDLGRPDVGTDSQTSEFSSGYQIGSRFLVSGQFRPNGRLLVWQCGYTKTWTASEANFWATVFKESPPPGNSSSPDLTVSVSPISPVADYVIPLLQGSPYWSPEQHALLYMPKTTYDSCLVDGTASETDGSAMLLLFPRERDEPCADIATRALITINGLDKAPAELTVTEDGETRTVQVVDADPSGPSGSPVDLPTNGWREGDDRLLAGIGGVLAVDDDGCVYLGAADAPEVRTYVLWPAGYTATLNPQGNLTIYGANGEPVAMEGDNLSMGGGFFANPGDEPCLPKSATEVASVQSEVTVRN